VKHKGKSGELVMDCPDELVTSTTSVYHTAMESDSGGDSYGEPGKAHLCHNQARTRKLPGPAYGDNLSG